MSNPLRRVSRTPMLAGMPREVGVIAAIAFFVALGFGIVAPSIPIYAQTFGVSAFLAGAVISAFALMRFVSSPVAGGLVDRLGDRAVLTTGLLIVAVSSVLAGLAQTYVQLLVLRGVGGFGSSMFTVSAMALMLKVVAPDQRGRAASTFQGAFLLGGVAGPAVGGLVIGISIRAPFFLYALTLAAAAYVSVRYLPALGQHTGAQEAPEHRPEPTMTLRKALGMRAYYAALAGHLTNGVVTFGLRNSLVPLFVVGGLGAPPGLAGVGFLCTAATEAVLLLPAGRVADERGRRVALLSGTTLTIAGMLGLAVAGATWPFLVAMAVCGLAAAFMGSAPAAIAGDVAGPGGRGMVIAVYQMTADFGAVVGPLVAGLLADTFGFGPAFAFGAVISAVAFALAAAMPETLVRRTT